MTIFKKKAADAQETKKLPMTGKVKKGFRAYCTMVIVGALALGMTTTAFAANDPLTVVNNLSDFIFGLIRAIGMILLGFGIVQVGLSLKSHDPSQRANGFLTLACCGMRNNNIFSEFVDCSLQRQRTNINERAHKSHGQTRAQHIF